MARLMRADAVLALEHVDRQVRVAQKQLTGDGEAEDPGADDSDVGPSSVAPDDRRHA